MKARSLSRILVVGFLAACGGSNNGPRHVELSGKPPAEGAALAADAVCDQMAACGSVSIVCNAGTTGTGAECTATINPRDYATCYEDAQGDIEEMLSCPALTPAQIDMMEACFDAMANRACLTQADADQLAAAAEANGGASMRNPPECSFLSEGLPGCG